MTLHGDAGPFHIRKENFDAARDAVLKKMVDRATKLVEDIEDRSSLRSVLCVVGLSVSMPDDVTHMWMDEGEDDALIHDVMQALGPFVEAGSSIRLYSEESDSHWLGTCYRFDGREMSYCDLLSVPLENDRQGMAGLLADMAAELVRDGVPSDEIMEIVQRAIVKDVMTK